MTDVSLASDSRDSQTLDQSNGHFLVDTVQPQWPGDQGSLPMPLRRLLVRLVAGPYVSAHEHRHLWATLVDHECIVRSRLNDLCLELQYDPELGVAFARNVTIEADVPKLMRSKPLSHVQTMLLVSLRQLHLRATAAGLDAYVTHEEITEMLRPYLETVEKRNDAQLAKRVNGAIASMVEYSLLLKTKEEGRYQVGNIVAFVVDASTAKEIARQYQAIIDGVTVTGGGTSRNDTEDDEATVSPSGGALPTDAGRLKGRISAPLVTMSSAAQEASPAVIASSKKDTASRYVENREDDGEQEAMFTVTEANDE